MTISYSFGVSNSSFLRFTCLLFRWKGSLYKYIWRELGLYLVAYYIVSFIYRFGFNESQQRIFGKLAIYSSKCYTDTIGGTALIFLLGFYLARIGSRWWDMFNTIPWPDKLGVLVPSLITGSSDEDRIVRRTLMRYVNLMCLLGFRSVSNAVLKRFPTLQHIVDAGIMTEGEMEIFNSYSDKYNKHFLPAQWAAALLLKARKEERISADMFMVRLIDEVNICRQQVWSMLCFDWISIPLMYTHVVTVAVYAFFGVCLISRQCLLPDVTPPAADIYDIYVPVFTILQFLFYVGLLKVAETNLNPFGVDDDDFEVNYIIERNLKVSYMLVDESFQVAPEFEKDAHWDNPDFVIPYTKASAHLKNEPREDSTAPLTLNPEESAKAEDANGHVNYGNDIEMANSCPNPRFKKSNFKQTSGKIATGLKMTNRNNIASSANGTTMNSDEFAQGPQGGQGSLDPMDG